MMACKTGVTPLSAYRAELAERERRALWGEYHKLTGRYMWGQFWRDLAWELQQNPPPRKAVRVSVENGPVLWERAT